MIITAIQPQPRIYPLDCDGGRHYCITVLLDFGLFIDNGGAGYNNGYWYELPLSGYLTSRNLPPVKSFSAAMIGILDPLILSVDDTNFQVVIPGEGDPSGAGFGASTGFFQHKVVTTRYSKIRITSPEPMNVSTGDRGPGQILLSLFSKDLKALSWNTMGFRNLPPFGPTATEIDVNGDFAGVGIEVNNSFVSFFAYVNGSQVL